VAAGDGWVSRRQPVSARVRLLALRGNSKAGKLGGNCEGVRSLFLALSRKTASRRKELSEGLTLRARLCG